jgi:ATP-dependent DNA ligase
LTLPIGPPFPPMEAESVEEMPDGKGWQYEPKWDGFRCLVFRDGDSVQLQSKAGQPLARYFPELVEIFRRLPAPRFVLDGEIAVPVDGKLSFDDLLQRIHPAESRVKKLATATPAVFIAFDLLVDGDGQSLVQTPLSERRKRLESFAKTNFSGEKSLELSPATIEVSQARAWLEGVGGDLDGVVAKRLDGPYVSGERAMQKVKLWRTADCVVGGFRYGSKTKIVGSLLLGLYDDDGKLDHVGFCSSIKTAEREALTPRLEKLVAPPGFTGRAPGGPSRWSTERTGEWQPLEPRLVVEVQYDHFSQDRFRHGTRFVRWRPDKAPEQCTMDQVVRGKKRG